MGLSKHWKTAALHAMIAGLKRSPSGAWLFVESVKNDLGIKSMHRELLETDGTYALREPAEAYTRNSTAENEALRLIRRYRASRQAEAAPRGERYVTCSRAKPAMRLYSSESRWSSARVM